MSHPCFPQVLSKKKSSKIPGFPLIFPVFPWFFHLFFLHFPPSSCFALKTYTSFTRLTQKTTGKIDFRWLQFGQKIEKKVFLTLKILNIIESLPYFFADRTPGS